MAALEAGGHECGTGSATSSGITAVSSCKPRDDVRQLERVDPPRCAKLSFPALFSTGRRGLEMLVLCSWLLSELDTDTSRAGKM